MSQCLKKKANLLFSLFFLQTLQADDLEPTDFEDRLFGPSVNDKRTSRWNIFKRTCWWNIFIFRAVKVETSSSLQVDIIFICQCQHMTVFLKLILRYQPKNWILFECLECCGRLYLYCMWQKLSCYKVKWLFFYHSVQKFCFLRINLIMCKYAYNCLI